ncbi:DNA/RNA non-specific endonuclease [Runella sp. CRIBMP]|uniref:DNA/RNA non-specific endonuclease n=1 Tax=Runella sp. CRIBMP TaxID=2683261 RepID=UPI0014135E4A|nr:DNA/RNA non-specific endonuclease [Runella sp. CRIBMP]NBB20466.1 DNA/RNA non-specific endonuclease [Runella sp. CRIBMP]
MRILRSSVYILSVYLLIVSCARQKITTSNDSIHLLLGNPTNAQASESAPDNYLIVKPQYALSYNRAKGHANWVAWELSQKWLGSSDRQNDFRPDPVLPASWYKVTPNDYTNSGFDRGHLCPSADRTNSVDNNSSTFVMTNMIPQAPELNREAWAYLEEYCRELVAQKYRLFIVCGTYGTGGEGSKGTLNKLDNSINVPARVYKVITILPENGTINDINANTPVIAVDFPNKTSALQNAGWFRFITTTADIEKKTGLTFFANAPKSTQTTLQSKRFDFTNAPLNVDTKCRQYNGRQLYIGKSGGCYYINSNGNKTYVDRDLCNCK